MKKRLIVLAILAGIVFASCSKQKEAAKQPETPAPAVAEQKAESEKIKDFGNLGNVFYKHCKDEIAAVRAVIADIKANPEGRTSVEKLQLFNKFLTLAIR